LLEAFTYHKPATKYTLYNGQFRHIKSHPSIRPSIYTVKNIDGLT